MDTHLTDAELVEAVQAGNLEAKWVLWLRHRPWLERWCGNRLADREEGRDVAGQVIEDFLNRYVYRIKSPQATRAYLFILAAAVCTKRIKERSRYKDLDDSDGDPYEHLPHTSWPGHPDLDLVCDPSRIEARAWWLARLERCFAKLKSKARAILNMKFCQDGVSDEEIGRVYGGGKAAIGQWRIDALNELEKCLSRTRPAERPRPREE